jgi:hypothetical protein
MQANNPSPRFPKRLVLRIAVPMVVVGIVGVIVFDSPDTRTVSQVIDEIHTIALTEPQGGLIGPWWVAAAGTDESTGRLKGFTVECGPIDIGAGTARVIVNHHSNTFQFEMWDVVFARAFDPANPEAEHTLQHMDRYMLGPLPYPDDIVADAAATSLPRSVKVQ